MMTKSLWHIQNKIFDKLANKRIEEMQDLSKHNGFNDLIIIRAKMFQKFYRL